MQLLESREAGISWRALVKHPPLRLYVRHEENFAPLLNGIHLSSKYL